MTYFILFILVAVIVIGISAWINQTDKKSSELHRAMVEERRKLAMQNEESEEIRELPDGFSIAGINYRLKNTDLCGIQKGTVKVTYDNPYDKNAIEIWCEGKHIGFIEKDENKELKEKLVPLGGEARWRGYIRTFVTEDNQLRLFGRIWIEGIDPEFEKVPEKP